jgi:hypothetical protein
VQVGAVESAQPGRIGGDRPREADAVEMGCELHGGQLVTATGGILPRYE